MLLEVRTDPEIPPLPPHIQMKMARKMSIAMMNDEERWGVMLKSAKGKGVEFKDMLTKG